MECILIKKMHQLSSSPFENVLFSLLQTEIEISRNIKHYVLDPFEHQRAVVIHVTVRQEKL